MANDKKHNYMFLKTHLTNKTPKISLYTKTDFKPIDKKLN